MALFGTKQKDDAQAKTPAAPAATKKGAKAEKNLSLEKDLSRVLIRPRITEKATLGIDAGKYTFEIDPRATKYDVKAAVKAIYNVTPEKVTIVRMSPQDYTARMRRRQGQRSGYKKAIVHLKKGQSMDIMK
ncbi:50S ribosomal protein L23 [Patescibacteria group bacterium]|jgi:large subunit ribosomal protein L23|nr:50S ribosomal protein L23 [Patescibacteria group bacterium]